MNKFSVAEQNIKSLIHIAHHLQELCDEVIFVGGSITGLLITDKAAPDVRFTADVDCIINTVTRSDYYSLEKKLRKKGFKQNIFIDHPICRWICGDTLLDIVPIDKQILGFSNRWYKEASLSPIQKILTDSINIKIISAPYFLATKIEAFKERGKNNFLMSHDLEDIISLLDGRPEIIDDIKITTLDLRSYLSEELHYLINNKQFNQSLPGHLNYSNETDSRTAIVTERIREIIKLAE